MTTNGSQPDRAEHHFMRAIFGIMAVGGGLGGFAALYMLEVPGPNKDPLMFALGNIFAWGTQVIQSEFGGGRTSRRLADAAADRLNPPHKEHP